jgi:hypothetical protein
MNRLTVDRWAANRLAVNRLAGNRLNLNRLAAPLTIALTILIATQAAGQGVRAASAKQSKRPLPAWGEAEQLIKRSLASRSGYKPGDILCKSEVHAALAKLETHGWTPVDREKIVKATPGDEEFIVQRLHAAEGLNFMRHVATYPDGYDRVDRMLHMPRGPTIVADLITNPGGYKLFQYMTTAPGGFEMGRMLEDTPGGRDFNDSTGRLYTEEKLLARIRKSYDTEKKRRELEAKQG